MRSRLLSAAAAIVAAGLIAVTVMFAGCGGDDSSGSSKVIKKADAEAFAHGALIKTTDLPGAGWKSTADTTGTWLRGPSGGSTTMSVLAGAREERRRRIRSTAAPLVSGIARICSAAVPICRISRAVRIESGCGSATAHGGR